MVLPRRVPEVGRRRLVLLGLIAALLLPSLAAAQITLNASQREGPTQAAPAGTARAIAAAAPATAPAPASAPTRGASPALQLAPPTNTPLAGEVWLDGPVSSTLHYNIVIDGVGIEFLTMSYLSYYGRPDGTSPVVDAPYWMRIVTGVVGFPATTDGYVGIDSAVVLPASTQLAIDGSRPVRCVVYPMDRPSQVITLPPSQCFQTPTQSSGAYRFTPVLGIGHGYQLEIQFPVVSSQALNGAGNGSLLTGSVQAVEGPDTLAAPPLVQTVLVAGSGGAAGTPAITNLSSSNIASGTADLAAVLVSLGTGGTAYFDYGTSAAYGQSDAVTIPAGGASWNLSDHVMRLTAGTTYHWRVRYVTSGGQTYASADQTFTTGATPRPYFSDISTTDIASTSAHLNAVIWHQNTNGTVYFDYGPTTSYGTTESAPLTYTAGTNVYEVTCAIDSGTLVPGTGYHWRMRYTTGGQTYSTPDEVFTTAGSKPTITDPTAVATGSTLTLSARVNNGGVPGTAYIDFGDTTAYGQTTTVSIGSGTYQDVSTQKTNIIIGKTYHWRVRFVARGLAFGIEDQVYTRSVTLVLPPGAFDKTSPANGATNVNTNATLTWEAAPNATGYSLCLSLTSGPSCGFWLYLGNVTSYTTTLTAGTHYYWQVNAINAAGSTAADGGTQAGFTTAVDLGFVTDVVAITVPEGDKSGMFRVKLNRQPFTTVNATVAPAPGSDPDITIVSGQALSFTTSNWNTYQTVVLAARDDSDTANGTAVLRVSASGLADADVQVAEVDNDTQEFQLTGNAVSVPEGGTITFSVRLTAQPAGTVVATVSRVSGDTDISVSGGASLTFTSSTWNTYQTVTLAAAQDVDTTHGTAVIRVSATNIASKDVAAVEVDNDSAAILTTSDVLDVPEGGSAIIAVKLNKQPLSPVTVSIVFKGGSDEDIQLISSSTLTFSGLNWANYKIVSLQAMKDSDASNGQATIRFSATGYATKDVTVNEADSDVLELRVSSNTTSVAEGGTGTFQVRLSAQPASPVAVTVTRVAGDTDMSVTGGASLSFTTADYATYKTVTLSAATDADSANGTATFRVSAPGFADVDVVATEADSDGGPPAFTDDPLEARTTTVRAVHFLELRSAIATLRSRYKLAPVLWSDPIVAGSTTIKAQHLTQLHTALQAVYDAEERARPIWSLIAAGRRISLAHVQEVREAIRAIW